MWVHVHGSSSINVTLVDVLFLEMPHQLSLSLLSLLLFFSPAFWGWHRNCPSVEEKMCRVKCTIIIYKYISMYIIYMKTTHFCTAFHGHVPQCFWTDRTSGSVSRFIVCYQVKITEVLWSSSFLCPFKPLWKINVIRILRYICHRQDVVTYFDGVGEAEVFIPVCFSLTKIMKLLR